MRRGRHYLHVRVTPVSASEASMRVIMQSPDVLERLPFTASDGTIIDASGSPYIRRREGRLIVGLRGIDCAMQGDADPVTGYVGDAMMAARATRSAVAELREALRAGA